MDSTARRDFEASRAPHTSAAESTDRRWEALWRMVQAAVVVHAADTSLIDANPAACALLGESLDDMRGRHAHHSMWRFVESDGTPMPVDRYPVRQLLTGHRLGSDFLLGICSEGRAQPRWVLCDGFTVMNDDGALHEIVVTFTDLTPLRLAQQALEHSQARLALTARIARIGGWSLERPFSKNSLLQMTDEARALIGGFMGGLARVPSTLGQALERMSDDDRRAVRRSASRCLRNGGVLEVEVTMRGEFPVSLRLLALWRNHDSRPVALEGAIQDVTSWRFAQQRLRLLEAAVSRLNDIVLITEAEIIDRPGPRIVFVNEAFERITGYTRAEAVGQCPRILQGPLTSRDELKRIRRAIEQGLPVGAELINYRKDGTHYWVELDIVPMADSTGVVRHFVSVQRDVSRRKELEAERQTLQRLLHDSQRMESIGTLAGGIAHDFNNILPAILGNAELARDAFPPAHAARANLEQITKAALRGRALVQQILTFSRRESRLLRAQPIVPILEETLMLLRSSLPASVKLQAVLPQQQVFAETEATQLQQVLMNLCTNGWHALAGKPGVIEVGLNDNIQIPISDLPPLAGRWAHLWVRDNGVGMDPRTRDRIFEPFFTTKPAGIGTGLGLSVVHGIVREHGGQIHVESAPGVGSVFHVYLPLVEAERVSDLGAPAFSHSRSGHGERVLYVDDDEVMVLLVEQLLEREGYDVKSCPSGTAALQWLEESANPPLLLISDYNMPDMTGVDLALRIRQNHPGLPVIITSGNVTADIQREAAALGVSALLEKQQTLEQLPALTFAALATTAAP